MVDQHCIKKIHEKRTDAIGTARGGGKPRKAKKATKITTKSPDPDALRSSKKH